MVRKKRSRRRDNEEGGEGEQHQPQPQNSKVEVCNDGGNGCQSMVVGVSAYRRR